jgi:hypothetical protein
VVGEDDEVERSHHMAKMLYGLVDCQSVPMVSPPYRGGGV